MQTLVLCYAPLIGSRCESNIWSETYGHKLLPPTSFGSFSMAHTRKVTAMQSNWPCNFLQAAAVFHTFIFEAKWDVECLPKCSALILRLNQRSPGFNWIQSTSAMLFSSWIKAAHWTYLNGLSEVFFSSFFPFSQCSQLFLDFISLLHFWDYAESKHVSMLLLIQLSF